MAIATGPWGDKYEVPDTAETPTPEITETVPPVTDTVTPTVVPETVETPAAETTEIPEGVIPTETPSDIVPPTPTEVIKEVEKIVEKYPEMDEHTGAIFQALMDGKEDVLLNYLSERHRDYNTMSDYDVVKTNLKKQNPAWSNDDLDLKIEVQYGEIAKIDTSALDPESSECEEALVHNKIVDRNIKVLKLDAIDARQSLEGSKKEIKLPKIEKQQVEVPEQPTAEQLAQGRADWENMVEKEIPNLKEFTFKVGDKDNGYEDVTYQVSDAERKEQRDFLKDVDLKKMVARLGWVDENGKQNIQKMAGDVLKLEKLQQIISSAYTQGKTTGTKGTVAEIKNLDFTGNATTSVAETPLDIGELLWGHINPK